MSAKKSPADHGELEHILAEARKLRTRRGNLYRDKALKILPWICAWCGREFTSKKLHELTVHHKDHNHDNNPPDGSNWELLCMYCHDNEHSRQQVNDALTPGTKHGSSATYKPFADLDTLLKHK